MENNKSTLTNIELLSSQIHDDLAKKIAYLFFDNVVTNKESEVKEKLIEILEQKDIDNVEFLTFAELTESCCLLNNISFTDNFRNTGLFECFNANLVFEKISLKDIKSCGDIEAQINLLKKQMSSMINRLNSEFSKNLMLRISPTLFTIVTKPTKFKKSEILFTLSNLKIHNNKPMFCTVKVPETYLNYDIEILEHKKSKKWYTNMKVSEVENFIKVILTKELEYAK